jgi:hypothetical protein
MTASQRPSRTGSGSPVRHALSRSLRALRDLHDEQVLAWESIWRSNRMPPARSQAPATARGGPAAAAPAGAERADQAA